MKYSKNKGNLPFMGQVMHCASCHREQVSNPMVSSGWTKIDAGDGTKVTTSFYLCPQCFSDWLNQAIKWGDEK